MIISRTLCIPLTLGFALACGGTPIKIEVGDTKIEVGNTDPEEEVAVVEPASQPTKKTTRSAPTPGPKPTPQAKTASGPGQIQVTTGRGISPTVDGAAMRSTTQGHFAQVGAGRRTVVIRNLLGKQKGNRTVTVKPGVRHILAWDGRTLSPSGEKKATAMPAEINLNSTVVITGLLVSDSSTTVRVAGRNGSRDASGSFRVPNVPPGSQSALIHAGGFDLFNGSLDVGFGGETRCNFLLGDGAWVPNCKHTP